MDDQGTKCLRNIAENLNRLSRAHERYRRQTTDRQTTDRRTGDSIIIANVNVSSRSLKTKNKNRCAQKKRSSQVFVESVLKKEQSLWWEEFVEK